MKDSFILFSGQFSSKVHFSPLVGSLAGSSSSSTLVILSGILSRYCARVKVYSSHSIHTWGYGLSFCSTCVVILNYQIMNRQRRSLQPSARLVHPLKQKMISINSALMTLRKVGVSFTTRISISIVTRYSRSSPLVLLYVLPDIAWCAFASHPPINRMFALW